MRRRHAVSAVARSALACALVGGCVRAGEDDAPRRFLPVDTADDPLAGLYTPGSKLGYAPAATTGDAGGGLSAAEQDSIEQAIEQAGMEDRCTPLEGTPGTPATLRVSFESDTYSGFYEPANCGAVWVEDATGHYVATAVIWAKLRARNLFIWNARRCEDDAPDAISSATLETHEAHEVVWDGRDQSGEVAPDGDYVLNIEVTEDELNYGRRTEVAFTKGAEAFVLEPDDAETVRKLSLRYEPSPEAGQ